MANQNPQSWEEFYKQSKTHLDDETFKASVKGVGKEIGRVGGKVLKDSSGFRPSQKIQFPTQQQVSNEQNMLGQLFGHGDKFFGSGEMLPFSGTPQNEGRDTWRIFGI